MPCQTLLRTIISVFRSVWTQLGLVYIWNVGRSLYIESSIGNISELFWELRLTTGSLPIHCIHLFMSGMCFCFRSGCLQTIFLFSFIMIRVEIYLLLQIILFGIFNLKSISGGGVAGDVLQGNFSDHSISGANHSCLRRLAPTLLTPISWSAETVSENIRQSEPRLSWRQW